MTSFHITDIKYFMNCFLNTQVFDDFLLEEATIVTYNTFLIDGHRIDSFYSKEELEDPAITVHPFSLWKDIKSVCFNLIKGKKTPVLFKFTLHANPEMALKILNDGNCQDASISLKALVINIKFENGSLNCITATSFQSFLLDKTPDILWDKAFAGFLKTNEISFEEL